MSSIHKDTRSKYWIAFFRNAQGKQLCRSTKIERNPTAPDAATRARLASENKLKAQQIADTYERAARGELSREQHVRETIAELVELAGGPRIAERNARDFFHAWLESSEKDGKSKTSLQRYTQITRDFLAYLGDKSTAPISHLTTDDIEGFKNTLTSKGLAKKTVLNTLKVLRIPFAEGCKLGKLTFNPAAAVTVKNVVSTERQAFTPAEIKSLLRACNGFPDGEQWKTAIHLGYFAAMRLGDATGLCWENLNFETRTINFTPEKTRSKGRKVEIPFHPTLEKHLATLTPNLAPGARLTPELYTGTGHRGKLSRQFGRLMIAAGIGREQSRINENQARCVSGKTFHSLRHSLTSHLAAAGIAPEVRMQITGHTDARTHAGYTHHERENLRAALEKVAG